MTFSFFVLLLLYYFQFFCGSYSQISSKLVWFSSFETDESDSWNVTSGNIPFQRILYSNISIPSQGLDSGDWAISAQGVNKEFMLPPVAYYGGKISVTFYAYVLQPSVLTVRFLVENYAEVQSSNVSIISNSWNLYSVPINDIKYPAFLVSFKYGNDDAIYMDSVKIQIDGSIMSCSAITSTNRCGFSTDVPSSNGWMFGATSVSWITTPAFTYLKRDFVYLGGLIRGSMNFRALLPGLLVTIQISVNQTSYQQQIRSGYTDFDLTASTQYTVGQTYTILITYITTSIKAQLSSISMYVAGNCSKCHAVLDCKKFTNGVTCACKVNSCLSPNTQCIVSSIDELINPCSCLPGYTTDSTGNCVDLTTTTKSTANLVTTTTSITTLVATTTSTTTPATTTPALITTATTTLATTTPATTTSVTTTPATTTLATSNPAKTTTAAIATTTPAKTTSPTTTPATTTPATTTPTTTTPATTTQAIPSIYTTTPATTTQAIPSICTTTPATTTPAATTPATTTLAVTTTPAATTTPATTTPDTTTPAATTPATTTLAATITPAATTTPAATITPATTSPDTTTPATLTPATTTPDTTTPAALTPATTTPASSSPATKYLAIKTKEKKSIIIAAIIIPVIFVLTLLAGIVMFRLHKKKSSTWAINYSEKETVDRVRVYKNEALDKRDEWEILS